mgnify:CR=1 FL=1
MFTPGQIKAAHSKVKSGADFPAYIKEIKAMGVTRYVCYVTDGHIDYYGMNGHSVNIPAKYDALFINDVFNAKEFASELKAHQLGKTDFPTFIRRCADLGVEKWAISMKDMTCTYYDKKGNAVLTEQIPD